MGYAYTHPTNPMLDMWVEEDYEIGPEGGTVYDMENGGVHKKRKPEGFVAQLKDRS